jgi:hypothetical protein
MSVTSPGAQSDGGGSCSSMDGGAGSDADGGSTSTNDGGAETGPVAEASAPDAGPSPDGAAPDGGVAVGDDGGQRDAGEGGTGPFVFQPSNVGMADLMAAAKKAAPEDLSSGCSIGTDASSPEACFASPIAVVTQPDGSKVDVVVVKSLAVEATGSITVTGGVPLVIVSLGDVTFHTGSFVLANSSNLADAVGPGGGAPPGEYMAGRPAPGGGSAATTDGAMGGGGGSYCGLGGAGGGTSGPSSAWGSQDVRPLVGGASGGGAWVTDFADSAGGGGIQIVAMAALTIEAGVYINAGGAGGLNSGNIGTGGGGSGGSILLEATSVVVAGTLAANGGGGGGQSVDQEAGDATANATPAPGGPAGTPSPGCAPHSVNTCQAAAGGAGSAGATISGSPGQSGASVFAGGGGGGAGRIRINSANAPALTGVFSPDATTPCLTTAGVLPLGSNP